MLWLHSLPPQLQQEVVTLLGTAPQAAPTIEKIYLFASSQKQKATASPRKKRQTAPPAPLPPPLQATDIIFHLANVSCQSPIRKRLGFVFHLAMSPRGPAPALSLVNADMAPEYTWGDLVNDVKFSCLLPILGNSTVAHKKDTVLLMLWLTNADPIVCHLNLDAAKKLLVDAGKVPAGAESELGSDQDNAVDKSGILPINEALVDFLQRQFQLVGITLANYLPFSTGRNRLMLNTDTGVGIVSDPTSPHPDVVLVQAYKGSKDGSLVLLGGNDQNQAAVMFGFRKPILYFPLSHVKRISYANITRLTFNVLVTVANEAKPDGEETLEFLMVDQAHYDMLDSFVQRKGINNDLFNETLREKQQEKTEPEPAGDSDDEDDDGTYQAGAESDSDEEATKNGIAGDDEGGANGEGEEDSEDEDDEDVNEDDFDSESGGDLSEDDLDLDD